MGNMDIDLSIGGIVLIVIVVAIVCAIIVWPLRKKLRRPSHIHWMHDLVGSNLSRSIQNAGEFATQELTAAEEYFEARKKEIAEGLQQAEQSLNTTQTEAAKQYRQSQDEALKILREDRATATDLGQLLDFYLRKTETIRREYKHALEEAERHWEEAKQRLEDEMRALERSHHVKLAEIRQQRNAEWVRLQEHSDHADE